MSLKRNVSDGKSYGHVRVLSESQVRNPIEVVISRPRRGNAAIFEEDANHVRVCKIHWRRQRERGRWCIQAKWGMRKVCVLNERSWPWRNYEATLARRSGSRPFVCIANVSSGVTWTERGQVGCSRNEII